jgi:hypothetical protein
MLMKSPGQVPAATPKSWRSAAVALLFVSCSWGQVQQPNLGAMLCSDGVPRAVFGVTGSVTLGLLLGGSGPVLGGVLSMGCSRRMCLMKSESTLVSLVGSVRAGSASVAVEAPPGRAMFWFESATGGSGDAALIYFPGSRQLARWKDGQLSPIDFDVAGEILSIGEAYDGTLLFAIRNLAGTWIVRNGGAIVQSLHGAAGSPGPAGSVLLLPKGVLFTTTEGLILRRQDASEMVFNLPRIEPESSEAERNEAGNVGTEPIEDKHVTLSWLGENYVQVRVRGSLGNDSNYALRIDPGHERLFLLPEPQP